MYEDHDETETNLEEVPEEDAKRYRLMLEQEEEETLLMGDVDSENMEDLDFDHD
jgi:hypothetical protein